MGNGGCDMNPWWLTFGLFAFGTVMLLIGFGNGHAMGYNAGLDDGVMIQKKAEKISREIIEKAREMWRERITEKPSDEDAAETTDNEIRHDRSR